MGPTSSGLPVRTLTGRIKIHPVGYGFVVPDDKSEDVHVSARNRGTAMDGDTVEIEAWPGARGVEGRVTARARARPRQDHRPAGAARASTRCCSPTIRASPAGVPERARSPRRKRRHRRGRRDHPLPRRPRRADGGAVLKVLGDPDDPRTEVEKVLACADVEEEFPDEVARIAAGFGDEVRARRSRRPRRPARTSPSPPSIPRRRATSTTRWRWRSCPTAARACGWRWPTSRTTCARARRIDDEARRRGCSIYLPNRAIPMLPEPLSARMCSLVPEEDRLAMVVRIDLDRARAASSTATSARR